MQLADEERGRLDCFRRRPAEQSDGTVAFPCYGSPSFLPAFDLEPSSAHALRRGFSFSIDPLR